ncbi:hydantoinase/oxoprolinase family protein [Acuticoccus sp.]|uniref:hydantoinase/oxoprolinase family protein n=1 Tax=Acuticoccus sp. TaxID=1904378 RepID=UPI003B524145
MSDHAGLALGIDIGGTFTDIVVLDLADGRSWSHKELTTHVDPADGVLSGVRHVAAAHGLELSRATRVAHATTLFTNALIERRGAVTGLLMTAGFSDTLQIGRERKYDLYDLAIERPTPLVPRNLCADVAERVHADGSVAVPLDEEDLLGAARRLVEAGATSLAVVFLHSFAHPAHERRAAELLLEAFPGVEVTISSEVAAQIREYERASTTAVNASIKPLAGLYLEGMRDRLVELGVDAPLHLLLSNGGLSDVAEAKRVPARLLESGPAAGAIAAAHFGAADGGGDLLAFDMGGTTAKLCCIEGGEPAIAFGFEAARERRFVPGSGLPVQISAIDLIEIGAGGGSIARVDRLGLLKVGPQSAGSEPGPAAYGRGGTEPTVTDADFLLGSLDPASFAGGGFGIDMTAAEAAVGRLAETLGLSLVETAAGIRDVVEEQMAAAARMHLAERGVDASRFALLATGGAGPVHADGLARKLRPAAGHLPALGRRRLRARPPPRTGAGGPRRHRRRRRRHLRPRRPRGRLRRAGGGGARGRRRHRGGSRERHGRAAGRWPVRRTGF